MKKKKLTFAQEIDLITIIRQNPTTSIVIIPVVPPVPPAVTVAIINPVVPVII